MSFVNQSPQKEIPEVSEVPSVRKDCKAFEHLAFSAQGTKSNGTGKSQRAEAPARSPSANSTDTEDIKAWESSGTLILQTPHGDASMQVHSLLQGWE